MKKCSYCGNNGKMTKEHIWPKCIITRAPELNNNYLASQNKMVLGELVISDVCGECNGKKLSKLDNYICSLYDKYFKTYKEEKKAFEFKYDYDLLLRSLLKITYNSSRTIKKNNNYFEKYKEYILDGGKIREDILIKLDIVTPGILNGQKIYPKSTRCGFSDLGLRSNNFSIRMVALNSYYFHIIFSNNDEVETSLLPELKNIIDSIPGSIIDPYKSISWISNFSTEDAISIHQGLADKLREIEK